MPKDTNKTKKNMINFNLTTGSLIVKYQLFQKSLKFVISAYRQN